MSFTVRQELTIELEPEPEPRARARARPTIGEERRRTGCAQVHLVRNAGAKCAQVHLVRNTGALVAPKSIW